MWYTAQIKDSSGNVVATIEFMARGPVATIRDSEWQEGLEAFVASKIGGYEGQARVYCPMFDGFEKKAA